MTSQNLKIDTQVLALGNCQLFINSRQLFVGQLEIPLTGLEYNLLSLLLSQSPKLVTRDAIANQVFSQPYYDCQASICTHVSHLRTKLTGAESGLLIKSVRGKGYFIPIEINI